MQFNRQGAETPAPQNIMPSAWDAIASRMVGRTAGITLLVAVLGFWLALMSWVITDPSLTNFTGTATRNWMGAPGAILSDLMLQTLGLAAVVALLAPMLWALELIATEKVEGLRLKLMLFPVSLLLVAGAFSSIPAGESWPLYNGLGGILGDLMFSLVAGVLGLVKSNHEGLAAGILLATFGLPALGHSTGLAMHDFGDLFHSAKTGNHDGSSSWFEDLKAKAPHGGPDVTHANEPSITPQPTAKGPSWPGGRTEPSFDDTPVIPTPVAVGPPAPWSDGPAVASDEDDQSLGLIDADQPTEPSSRTMARRFAPRNGAGAAERQDHATLEQEPVEAPPRPSGTPAPAAKPALMRGLKFNGGPAPYQHPSLNLLKRPAGPKAGLEHSQAALRGSARLLEEVLADFSVKGEVKDIRPGPVVTLFELEPARGTKSSRVVALADDIARSMSATSVRVAVVPGRNAIGIELPNVRREGVLLREIFESDAFKTSTATLPIALGKSIGGEPVVADLTRMPHLLVAGTTGSGKSVGVNAMILSLLYRLTPDQCRFIMIDPKMLELSVYNGIPHLLAPVVTDPMKAINALNWVVGEMEERYKRMSKLSVRNIDVFNNRVRNAKQRGEAMARRVQTGFDRRTGEAIYEQEDLNLEPMPYIVVVVDEFADLMVVAGKEIEGAVQRLAQMARAAGIHLIMATQRPSVDIITGTIKANFPTRVSFKVTSKIDSRTILNEQGAEQLLGQGDMLYSSGSGGIVRVHGAFVSDEEVESIAAALRTQGKPRYVDDILDDPDGGPDGDGSETRAESGDDLFDKAVAIVLRDQKASTSYIQRRLSIGYNKAASLIERMEDEGLISPANALGKREILSGSRRGSREPSDD